MANAVARLEEAGFRRLDEREPWPDVSGGRFVERGGALVAWRSPADATASASFACSLPSSSLTIADRGSRALFLASISPRPQINSPVLRINL